MKITFTLLVVLLCFYILTAQTQLGEAINGEAAGDASAYSLDFSADGQRVAIGTPRNSDAGIEAGHVRVYEYQEGVWIQLGADIDGKEAESEMGRSVALSADGSRVAVGAPAQLDTGYVQVYQYVAATETWTQVGEDLLGKQAEDGFGWELDFSSEGHRLVVGAPFSSGAFNLGDFVGQVRVFEYIDSTWTQIGSDIEGEASEDLVGFSVAMSPNGDRIAVGAPLYNQARGLARIYEYTNGDWTLMGEEMQGEASPDFLGIAFDFSSTGDRLAVGVSGMNNFTGEARVFEYIDSTWVLLGAPIVGEGAGDYCSDKSLGLSADGNRILVGAVRNDGAGKDAGHARLFDYIDGEWTQVGMTIEGEAAGDEAGWAIALSADGTRAAIGARGNDSGGNDAGHVRVFEFSPISSVEIVDDPNVKILPNPASTSVEISGLLLDNAIVNILDVTGKIIQTISSSGQRIEVSELPSGFYFISIDRGEQRMVKSLVKE